MLMKTVAAAVFCGGLLCGQTGGIMPEWEVSKAVETYASQWKGVQESLAQAKPQEWVQKGASEAYVRQWQSCQEQAGYVIGSLDKVAKQPDKLTAVLDAYFRIESLEAAASSVIDGVRRYQNPAIADLMSERLNKATAGRDKFRQFVVDLAASKEKEFQMVDSEAQRCRGVLMREPVTARQAKPGTKAVSR